MKLCSTHEIKIEKLNNDILKSTQQNKELICQLEEMTKINHDNDYKKQIYHVKIEVMKKDFEKLQSCCDAITTQRDKVEENLATISHNAEQNKKKYEFCIETLKNELCTKANDLSNSLKERDNLLEEISNKNQIIYNLNCKLQHEHENFLQFKENNLKCMVAKEAKSKQLYENMIYENLEYKDSNGKLKIEIVKLNEENCDLILQLNEEKSRIKLMEVEATASKALSKKIEEGLQSRILKNKKILFLAKQRSKDFMLEKNYLQVQYDKMFSKICILENQHIIMSWVVIALWYFHVISKTKCDNIATKVLFMKEKIICSIFRREIKILIENDTMVNCQQDQLVSNKNHINFDQNLFLSKHIENLAKLTFSVFSRIYLQKGAIPSTLKLKPLCCIQANEDCLIKYSKVRSNKLMVFSNWKHNHLPNRKLKIKIMNLIEVNKQKPKILKLNVLQRTINLSMWEKKTYTKAKLNLKNKILIFINKRFQLDLEYVEKIKYSMNFSIKIYKAFKKLQIKNKVCINLKITMMYLTNNDKTIFDINCSRNSKLYGYFLNIKESMCAINSTFYFIPFSNDTTASNGIMKNSVQIIKILQVLSNFKIWDLGICCREKILKLNK